MPTDPAPHLDPAGDHEVDHDWFGVPIHVDGGRLHEPVPCPRCGAPFRRRAVLEAHLAEAHAVSPRQARPPGPWRRLRHWARGLRFLSPWFVLPLNAVLTLTLYLAFGQHLELFSLDDPGAVAGTWAIRLSILPSVLLLSWRVVHKQV